MSITNKCEFFGNLTGDARIGTTNDGKKTAFVTIAAQRQVKKNADDPNQITADFIGLKAYDNENGRQNATFLEKYGKKGQKFLVEAHVRTWKTTNEAGETTYGQEIVIDQIAFGGSKSDDAPATNDTAPASAPAADNDAFMNIPDGIDEELPFS